nr:PREDICTED: nose resistant to fluoxetine protein 6-like isoform X2 [Tribolium castaneum]|eukprot:XP_015834703.1 PREDICTED: nose resistant to fluoxetine protein 6-like isoform X2 [Tribolium castaneum]
MLKQFFTLFLVSLNTINAQSIPDFLNFAQYYEDVLEFLSKLEPNECNTQLLRLFSSLQNETWARDMLDASAKPQAGIFMGNIMHVGNYDECLRIPGKYCSALFQAHPEFAPKYLKDYFSKFKAETAREDQEEELYIQGRFSLGLCVPRVCRVNDLQNLSNVFENRLKFPLHFTFVEDYCDDGEAKPITAGAVVAIVIFSLFGVIVVASTLYDFFVYQYVTDKKPNIHVAFSMLTNGKKLLSTKTAEGNLNCLNGLRVISLMWIVLGHGFQYSFYVPVINSLDMEEWKNFKANCLIIACSVAVDTFFVISGLLLVYLFLKSEAKGAKFSIPMFYLHRILRLTPSLAMAVLFTATLINYMGKGPFWPIVHQMFQKDCQNYWWATLLYIQNYAYPHNQCVGQSWYLAVDTQMYFLSPLILFPLVRWPKKTLTAIGVFVVLNCSYVFEITWKKQLGTTLFDQEDQHYELLYSPTHVRGVPYLIGMACGYLVFQYKTCKNLKLSKTKILFLWSLALGTLVAIVIIHYPMTQGNKHTDLFQTSFFNSLHRVVWSLALCVLIILCINGYGGLINSFLSHKIFTVLIRLNYNIYLLHMALLTIMTAQKRTPGYFSDLFCFHQFWGDYMFSVATAILWTLVFESPILMIEKIIFAPS